jgi:rhodanese-related sulfurtransferase
MSDIVQLSPAEVKARLDANEDFVLLDVREVWEFEFNRIEGAVLAPMSDFPKYAARLDKEKEYVVYCHHGIRSMHACGFLKTMGFTKLSNLTGGIDAWSYEVDPSVPLY